MASPKINGKHVACMNKETLLAAARDTNNRKHRSKALREMQKRGLSFPS